MPMVDLPPHMLQLSVAGPALTEDVSQQRLIVPAWWHLLRSGVSCEIQDSEPISEALP